MTAFPKKILGGTHILYVRNWMSESVLIAISNLHLQ